MTKNDHSLKYLMTMSIGEMPYAGFKYFTHGFRLYKIKHTTEDSVVAEPVEVDGFDLVLNPETEVQVYNKRP